MRKFTTFTLGGLLFLIIVTVQSAPLPEGSADANQVFTRFLDEEYAAWLALNPSIGFFTGLPDFPWQLTDRSVEHDQRLLAWQRESTARMRSRFDRAKLNDVLRTAWDTRLVELEIAEARSQFPLHEYWFGGIAGAHTVFPRYLMTRQIVKGIEDFDHYAKRIHEIGRVIDQLQKRAEAAARQGIRMPAFAYNKAIASNKALLDGAPFTSSDRNSPVWNNVQERIQKLRSADPDLSDDAVATAEASVRAALLESFAPAYTRLNAWLEDDQSKASAQAQGVGALPGGLAWYDVKLFEETGLHVTADEIHEIGLAEVARIRREMEAIKTKIGFAGSLTAFFEHLRTSPEFYLPNTDEGRDQYLQRARDYIEAIKARQTGWFGLTPRSPLEARRQEAFSEEPGGAANYVAPPVGGNSPGILFMHLIEMKAMPTWQLESLSYHEGIPGHHTQMAIQRELLGVPRTQLTARNNAYGEGWGLYAERVAKEMGFLTDPVSDFGRLVQEQWRAVRLVVDTGLHAKGWSQQEAVDYFTEHVALPTAVVRSEVERYLVQPGQAVGYKMGMLTILKLRDEAKAALGNRFDIRRFHDVVIGAGTMPLPVLETRVREWIESTGTSHR